ncbi:hypothetical protein [Salibacterium halotolerans]|uniref:hypothetical protein n=1 Tax=Salibacterium halotolerans TaxID=1884432 RepID=UPI000B81DDAA|nr:hypothetical protein [Salibacterium halotolerans]
MNSEEVSIRYFICFASLYRFGYIQYKEKQQYETYMNQDLIDAIINVSSAAYSNISNLERVLSSEEMEVEQWKTLKRDYNRLLRHLGKIEKISICYLNRLEQTQYSSNEPSIIALESVEYLN